MLPQASVAPDGSLYVILGAAGPNDVRVGGVLVTPEGAVHINGNAPQRFDQGKGFTNNGDLCLDLLGEPTVGYVGGLPVTATGAIKAQLNQPVSPGDAFVGGLRVGPLGGVYVTDTTPVVPFEFTNAFSNSFPASAATVSPPVNTVAPNVTGNPQSGSYLTCTPGTWTGANSISFRWFRDNIPMPGETGSTFAVTSPDIGKVMTCVVTALNEAGASSAASNSVTILP